MDPPKTIIKSTINASINFAPNISLLGNRIGVQHKCDWPNAEVQPANQSRYSGYSWHPITLLGLPVPPNNVTRANQSRCSRHQITLPTLIVPPNHVTRAT